MADELDPEALAEEEEVERDEDEAEEEARRQVRRGPRSRFLVNRLLGVIGWLRRRRGRRPRV